MNQAHQVLISKQALKQYQNRTIYIAESVNLKMVPKTLSINFNCVFVYPDFTNFPGFTKTGQRGLAQSPQGKLNIHNRKVQFIQINDPAYNAYLHELNIFNQCRKIRSLNLILNTKQYHMQIIGSQSQEEGRRLNQALLKYILLHKYIQIAQQINVPFNLSLCQNLMSSFGTSFRIAPQIFSDSYCQKQIQLYGRFLETASEISQLTFLFKIIDEQSLAYSMKFMNKSQNKLIALNLIGIQLFDGMLKSVVKPDIFAKLQTLNLRGNCLSDICFPILAQLLARKKSVYINKVDLSKNQITLKSIHHQDALNFLQQAQCYIDLNLAQNRITDNEFILNYFVFAEEVPLKRLDFRSNPIPQDQLIEIAVYFANKKQEFQLCIGQIGLSHPSCFQIIAKQANKSAISMTIKIQKGFKKDSLKKQNSQVSKYQQKSRRPSRSLQETQKDIQRLQYAYEYGDFLQISSLLASLTQDGYEVNSKQFQAQRKQKKLQEQVILRQMHQLSKLDIEQQKINSKIDDFIRKAHRKGLRGQPINYFCYLKYVRDQKITQLLQIKYNPLKELFKKYVSNYEFYLHLATLDQNSFVSKNVNYWKLVQTSDQKLIQQVIKKRERYRIQPSEQNRICVEDQIRLSYLLNSNPSNMKQTQIQMCRLQLKLCACKLIHNHQKSSQKQLLYRKQYGRSPLKIEVTNPLEFLSMFQIYHYPLDLTARRNGFQGYQGILCTHDYKQYRKQLQQFSKIVVSFLKYLYFDPSKLLSETVQYLDFIINQVRQSKDPIVFAEQLYLHMFTFNTKAKLVKGILKRIFQLLTACIQNSEQIEPFIVAHLIKYQPTPISQIRLHLLDQNGNKLPKLDWLYRNKQLQALLINDGMVVFSFGTTRGHLKQLWAHHLTTIGELFQSAHFAQQIVDLCPKGTVNDYWFFNTKNRIYLGYDQYIPYYQTLGKLTSEHSQILFKRVFFDGKCINKHAMMDQSNEIIEQLYSEIKYNYKNLIELPLQGIASKVAALIISQMKIAGHGKGDLAHYLQQIQNYFPSSNPTKLAHNISEQQKNIIEHKIRQKMNNSIFSRKQSQIDFIIEAGLYCQTAKNGHHMKQSTFIVSCCFHSLSIHQILAKQQKKITIPWNCIIGIQFLISEEILQIHYTSDNSDLQLKTFQIRNSESKQANTQQQWILNVYIILYGFALKRINCDLNTLYHSANSGFCSIKKSQQQNSKARANPFLELSKFIIKPNGQQQVTSLTYMSLWQSVSKKSIRKQSNLNTKRSSKQRLPRKLSNSQQFIFKVQQKKKQKETQQKTKIPKNIKEQLKETIEPQQLKAQYQQIQVPQSFEKQHKNAQKNQKSQQISNQLLENSQPKQKVKIDVGLSEKSVKQSPLVSLNNEVQSNNAFLQKYNQQIDLKNQTKINIQTKRLQESNKDQQVDQIINIINQKNDKMEKNGRRSLPRRSSSRGQ